MNHSKQLNRRKFVKLSTAFLSSIPVLATQISLAQDSTELIELTEDDPSAQALAYKADASTVDSTAYPNFEPSQLCSNCLYYQGKEGDVTGPCTLFPGKSVTAAGWCSVYVPIPS